MSLSASDLQLSVSSQSVYTITFFSKPSPDVRTVGLYGRTVETIDSTLTVVYGTSPLVTPP